MENMDKDFLELAANRYSVRKFIDKPVEQEDLDKILKAGYLTPTACNRQPQRILVINSNEGRARLKRCTKRHFDALTALLICCGRTDCWQRKYGDEISGGIDASIATVHMMLEAAAIGVGTTWVMYSDPAAAKLEFKVSESYESTALLIMGHPALDTALYPGHSEYRPIKETVFCHEFQKISLKKSCASPMRRVIFVVIYNRKI